MQDALFMLFSPFFPSFSFRFPLTPSSLPSPVPPTHPNQPISSVCSSISPPPLLQDSVRQRQVQMLSLTGQLRSKVDTLRKELETRRRSNTGPSIGKETSGSLNLYHHQLQHERTGGGEGGGQSQQAVITTKYEPVNI